MLCGTAYAHPPKRIVFPVVGKVRYHDDFGAPRAQGAHQGNDILADRRAPAVAAEAGRVSFHTTSRRAGCMLYLRARSGTTYLYVHLNNDLTRGNDNRGGCVPGVAYAPGLRDGQRVRAGQLVGYVGDSGDADGGPPHLHFELHPNGRGAVSPYPWLRSARRVLFATPPRARQTRVTLRGRARSAGDGRFTVGVTRVRPRGGSWADVGRRVVLAVAPTAVVERNVNGVRRRARLERMTAGERVAVRTSLLEPTLPAQLGRPGVLVAETILLRGT